MSVRVEVHCDECAVLLRTERERITATCEQRWRSSRKRPEIERLDFCSTPCLQQWMARRVTPRSAPMRVSLELIEYD